MRKIIFLLLMLILFSGCVQISSNNSDIIDCNEDYECLFEQSSNGNPARLLIIEEVPSLSLIEQSEIKVQPINGNFSVSFKIIDLIEIKKETKITKSIVDSISEGCPQIINNFDKIKSKQAICFVNSPEEVKELAINGLSEDSIKKYGCSGELIDAINDICVSTNFPNFPPGVKKPAIYLYPEKTSEIEVKVDINGFITKTSPTYLDGWKVMAEPNGLIDKKYDCLFYEAQLKNIELPQKGWVVSYSEISDWFDENLPVLGLNEKEISQFKEYWMKELIRANYYEIRLLENKFLEENMNLIINPEPDNLIRLNFYFKPLSDKIEIEKPIIETPKRTGFTVVEWGGILDDRIFR